MAAFFVRRFAPFVRRFAPFVRRSAPAFCLHCMLRAQAKRSIVQ